MDPQKRTGRTAGDTFLEIITNWKLLFTVFGSLLLALVFVVNDSEPGSSVEIFGLKYQRAKGTPKTVSEIDLLVSGYSLPQGETFTVERESAHPILDGTIAIESNVYRSQYVDQKPRLVGGAITGVNIAKVKIGSRSVDGRVDPLFRDDNSDIKAIFGKMAYIELEYKGAYFSLKSEPSSNENFRVTLNRIKLPTLDLVSIDKLPEESRGDD